MGFARAVCLVLILVPAAAVGQDRDEASQDWRVLVRPTLSGGSHASTPEGYEISGGLALEGAMARRLGAIFAVELSVRTESREAEGPAGLAEPHLGSLEMIPINLTLQWRPLDRSGRPFQPYAGAGVNATVIWEKSGALDSTDPPDSLGPVGQLGTVIVVSPRIMLNADVKWHPFDVDLQGFADPTPTIEIDPLSIGVGLGFSF